ncbi:polysaccharide deacetylase family protein [Planctomycetota bacterium]
MKKKIEAIVAWIWGTWQAVFSRMPKRVILYYHGINREEADSFKKQMDYLAKHCHTVAACEIINAKGDAKLPTVAITFDDAFISVMELAIPVLEEYNLPATIFVPTGWMGQTADWKLFEGEYNYVERVVDHRQLLEWTSLKNIDIQSHTVNHPMLTKTDESTLIRELRESKETLEQILGKEITAISYPYGRFNQDVLDAAQKVGYQQGFTIDPKVVSDKTRPLEIGRFKVDPREGLATFGLKTRGNYEAVNLLRWLKRKVIRKGKNQ